MNLTRPSLALPVSPYTFARSLSLSLEMRSVIFFFSQFGIMDESEIDSSSSRFTIIFYTSYPSIVHCNAAVAGRKRINKKCAEVKSFPIYGSLFQARNEGRLRGHTHKKTVDISLLFSTVCLLTWPVITGGADDLPLVMPPPQFDSCPHSIRARIALGDSPVLVANLPSISYDPPTTRSYGNRIPRQRK